MIELRAPSGAVGASLEPVTLTPESLAIRVLWRERVDSVPDTAAWSAGLEAVADVARVRGARRIEVRVLTLQAGDAESLAPRRAEPQREALRAAGFVPGAGRVEYIVAIDPALTALSNAVTTLRLSWRSVASVPGPELDRVATLMQASAEGDRDFDPTDDARALLLSRAEDTGVLQAPECVQVGSLHGDDAALALPSFRPATGVGSLFYLGVLPRFRGRALGAEVMLRGLGALHAMGARTYHDGTAADNTAARRLFALMATQPSRVMEQWRLEL